MLRKEMDDGAKAQDARPKTAEERMSARRKRLRRKVFAPGAAWVPDLSDPKSTRGLFAGRAGLLPLHPENDAIDEWIEAVYDWSEWR